MKKAYVKYIASLLLFGTNGIVASMIRLSSYEIVLLRTLLGSLFLISLFFLTKGKPTFYRHKKQFLFLAVSGVAMGASWIFLYEAYAEIGVSLASLAYYCGPIIVIILSPLLFGERLTVLKITAFITVLFGVFLVNGTAFENGKSVWGIVAGLLSAVTYSLMVIFNKKAKDIRGIENASLQLLIAFVTVAAFVALTRGIRFEIDTTSILPALVLGLFNTGFGCYLYFSSIGRLPVQSVAICGCIELLSAVVFSMIFLGETMLLPQIVGGILIVGGTVVSELRRNEKETGGNAAAKEPETTEKAIKM